MKAKNIVMMAVVSVFSMGSIQAQNMRELPMKMEGEMEDCDDCEDEMEPLTEKQIRKWIKKNAPWGEELLDKELKAYPDEKEEILEEVSEIIYEYEYYAELSDEAAELFLKIVKKEYELETRLESLEGKDEAEIKEALRDDLTELITAEIQLEKITLKAEVQMMQEELKELEEAEGSVEEIVEEELDAIASGEYEDEDDQ